MLQRIAASLDTIALGGSEVIQGVRVSRRSLLGFQVGGSGELLDAREAAHRIAALARCRAVRVSLCTRCGGDGLGRRDRGVCGLCRGPGIQVAAPAAGFREAAARDAATGVEQALLSLGEARHARARASLLALLAEAMPAAPRSTRARAVEALRAAGFEREAAAFAEVAESTRAA